MVKLIPFKPEHFKLICARPLEQKSVDAALGKVDHLLEHWDEKTIGFTAVDEDGTFIGTAGVTWMWDGVGEAWMFASDRIYKHKLYVAKQIKRQLAWIEQELMLHRVYANVPVTQQRAKEFIEWLGFEYEGRMRKHCHGMDYDRYARVH